MNWPTTNPLLRLYDAVFTLPSPTDIAKGQAREVERMIILARRERNEAARYLQGRQARLDSLKVELIQLRLAIEDHEARTP